MATEILVVDDSAAERIFIGHFLRKFNEFNVRFACNGQEALEHVAACSPSVIVSDLHMPGMNGLDLVRQLNAAAHDIPVVLMTSRGSEDIAVKTLRAGAASYVPKRVMDTELVRTLRKVISLTVHKSNRRRHLENMTMLESHSALDNDDASLSTFVSYILDHVVQMKLLRGQEVTQVGIALQEVLATAIYQGNLGLDADMRQVDEVGYFKLAEQRRSQWPYAERRIFVEAKLHRSALRFVVRHQGERCSSAGVQELSANPNMDRISGRSQTLVNNFMDFVSHQADLNQTTMVKNVTVPLAECERESFSDMDTDLNWNAKRIVETQPVSTGHYLA